MVPQMSETKMNAGLGGMGPARDSHASLEDLEAAALARKRRAREVVQLLSISRILQKEADEILYSRNWICDAILSLKRAIEDGDLERAKKQAEFIYRAVFNVMTAESAWLEDLADAYRARGE